MPFTISWYMPERIIYVELSGILTASDVQGFIAQMYEMVASSKFQVHSITDTHQIVKIKSIPEVFKTVQAAPMHQNAGWSIMVGSINPFVNFVADFVSSIMHSRYRRFDRMQQAIDFIKERDETLTDVPIQQV